MSALIIGNSTATEGPQREVCRVYMVCARKHWHMQTIRVFFSVIDTSLPGNKSGLQNSKTG